MPAMLTKCLNLNLNGDDEMATTTVELTREQILARLEAGAQRRRRLSARELLLRYRAGKLEEPCEVADLLALADLLPHSDPIFAAA